MHEARYRSSALAAACGIMFQTASNHGLRTKLRTSAIVEEPAGIEKVPSVERTLDGSTRPTTGFFQIVVFCRLAAPKLGAVDVVVPRGMPAVRAPLAQSGHGAVSFDRQQVQIKA
jgi:hypothetical protein